jgi:sirohydrochlorin ferrochelatase
MAPTDAVLLLSHGSRDPRAAHAVAGLATAVAERTNCEVYAAHLGFTTPTPDVALRRLADDGFRAVRIVPLLFTPGYHSTHDVPLAVELSAVTNRMNVSVASPLLAGQGDQRELLLVALADRLLQAGADEYVDGLVLASAGSSSKKARLCLESLARDLERSQGVPVELAFASAGTPSPTQALEALSDKGVRRPAVASLFVASGRLSDSVVAACADLPVAQPLGATPAFVELLVARAKIPPPENWPYFAPTELRSLVGGRA